MESNVKGFLKIGLFLCSAFETGSLGWKNVTLD